MKTEGGNLELMFGKMLIIEQFTSGGRRLKPGYWGNNRSEDCWDTYGTVAGEAQGMFPQRWVFVLQ